MSFKVIYFAHKYILISEYNILAAPFTKYSVLLGCIKCMKFRKFLLMMAVSVYQSVCRECTE